MNYNMSSSSHEIELNIDEGNLNDISPMKISVNVSAAQTPKSEIDELLASYKAIDYEKHYDYEEINRIVDGIVKYETEHTNDLKNIALIWDHDFPIMVQGDLTGMLRHTLFMSLVNSMIHAYLTNPNLSSQKMMSNLESKATLLLRLSETHNFGEMGNYPATYQEVTEEKARIMGKWDEGAC